MTTGRYRRRKALGSLVSGACVFQFWRWPNRLMTYFRRQPDAIFWICAIAMLWQAVGQAWATDIWFNWLWAIMFLVAAVSNVALMAGNHTTLIPLASSTTVTALLSRPVGLLLDILKHPGTKTWPKTFIGVGLYVFVAIMCSYVYNRTAVRRAVGG